MGVGMAYEAVKTIGREREEDADPMRPQTGRLPGSEARM
jgi:hypothetical protein